MKKTKPSSDSYVKELEQRIEELAQVRAQYVRLEWRHAPLNENRWDLHAGKDRTSLAILMHTATDIHKKGCFWQLAFTSGENSFHKTMEEAQIYAQEKF
jgi:hypothetical protein